MFRFMLCLLALVNGIWPIASGDEKNASGGGPAREKSSLESFRIVAYVPDYAMDNVAPDAYDRVTDAIFFSAVLTEDGAFPAEPLSAARIAQFQGIKREHRPRIHLCFGGWGRSSGFAAMTLDVAKRNIFIEALAKYCIANSFDGVDYDWEFPASKEEHAAYDALLVDTAAMFHPLGLEVSIALGWHETLDKAAYAAVDRIHLMTYDIGKRHSMYSSAKSVVRRLLRSGAPKEKICLGVPFYGRKMDQPDTSMSYANILGECAPKANADEAGGFYFNNAATIRKKTHFAIENGLAGIMIWEISMDTRDETSLLRVIQKERSIALEF